MKSNRRKFIKQSFASAAGMAATTMIPADMFGHGLHDTARPKEIILKPRRPSKPQESIKFGVIGMNHGHIYGMVKALIQGGGEMVAVYAKEKRGRNYRKFCHSIGRECLHSDRKGTVGNSCHESWKGFYERQAGYFKFRAVGRSQKSATRNQAHIFDHVQRKIRESCLGQSGGVDRKRGYWKSGTNHRTRTAPHATRYTPRLVFRP